MANAGCINAIGFDGTYLRTLDTLDSANIGVGVQYCIPAPLDDKRLDYIKYTDKCGCTCCITGENEILVYATNGVIKNFTLTNDDTNEVVKVKWNDLFGSNRAYTMVRYKTGSYPTSISDGTLAVKETTQNQYSVSGYNVSGLTDGTTYYFTAFAVSQDGTIIVVQNKNITTDFKRAGYQRVEYIESSGTQRIDTGIYATQATKFQVKIMPLEQQGGVIFGQNEGSDTNDYRLFNASGTIYLDFPGGGGIGTRINGGSWNTNVLGEFECGNFYVKNVGASSNIISGGTVGNFTTSWTLRLNKGKEGNAKTRCYYIKIRKNGTTQDREMYAAYRKSDGVIGMYDILHKQFYINSGTGTFTKGANIPNNT